MKVLITGFDPFGNESINPAWEAVKALPNHLNDIEIIKLQIPTIFHKATQAIIDKANEIHPDVIIAVGQAGGRFDISPERVAINIDDARIADNNGNQPIDQRIYADGENAYFSNLPIKAIVQAIKNASIPASVSNTAGTFVCNHVMYGILHHIEKHQIAKRGGFIHVPFIPEQVINKPNTPSMDKTTITKALTIAIETIARTHEDIATIGGTEC